MVIAVPLLMSGAAISDAIDGFIGSVRFDDDQPAVAEDVGVVAGDGEVDARRAARSSGLNEPARLQEVVRRVAVEQRRRRRHHQAFLAIGDVDVGVDRRDRLLLVHRQPLAHRIDGERARRGDRRRIARLHVRVLADRRHRRRHDLLGEALLVDLRDVEDLEAAFAVGDVEVLAALLHRQRVRRTRDGWRSSGSRPRFSCAAYCSGYASLCRSLPITACGSSISVTATASHAAFAGADVDEPAHEVDEVGALQSAAAP